jgi:tRNA-dihydrouridine synthase B
MVTEELENEFKAGFKAGIKIGSWEIKKPTILAPMAGVTDEPFRELCLRLGAGMAVSEMVTSETRLWNSRKSRHRLHYSSKSNSSIPRSVQLAGNDPAAMAQAARANVELGADIIDINMGCPAKKVCKKAAGSALLRDEALVHDILSAVVAAVDVPVTLKIRTGWSLEERNGITIARMAEDCGIQALAVHGRTRACAFKGEVEYDTIAKIVDAVAIPVFANGDITSPEKAKYVLNHTKAAAVMIGRAAQGNPWIFEQINHYLETGEHLTKPSHQLVSQVLTEHLQELHQLYGGLMGVRIARKHLGWYLKQQTASEHYGKSHEDFRQAFNRMEDAQEQLDAIEDFFTKNQFIQKELKEEIAA